MARRIAQNTAARTDIPQAPAAAPEPPSEALMLAYAAGEEAAFEELLRRHQRGVFSFVYRMTQNRTVAEEITQEVFLALVKNRKRYKPTAKFTTYLYTIASNMVSKEWLKRKRRPTILSIFSGVQRDNDEMYHPLSQLPDEKANTLEHFTKREISEAVVDALRHLPEHQRKAFVLRRFQDLPYDEIASITGVPVGTAKSRVVRAERALRPHLQDYHEYLSSGA